MTIDEFASKVGDSLPHAPEDQLRRLESDLGVELPADYRHFLTITNGGTGNGLCFVEPTGDDPGGVGLHHIGGFRKESYFSLTIRRARYQDKYARIPRELLWIADDSFGNAICIGILGPYRGKVYFWDHEEEPDPDEWDGSVESAGNITPLADSFTAFVAGLRPIDQV
jgi:hypothetical protein